MKKKVKKIFICIFKIAEERSGSGVGSRCQRYGSGDPDPHQNVTDPQLCFVLKWCPCCTIGSRLTGFQGEATRLHGTHGDDQDDPRRQVQEVSVHF
jgi:hypothetical protein